MPKFAANLTMLFSELDFIHRFARLRRPASRALGEAGIRLLVEPINTRDIPGFYLCRTAQALEIIDEVGSENLFLQYDIYHMQIMEGDLARTLADSLPRIAHVQLADSPGRNEAGTGEINYAVLFRHLDRISYRGWIEETTHSGTSHP